MIDTVRADAAASEPLVELETAARTSRDLENLSDALLDHFVSRARQSGHSWSEISAVLGVSKQAAHKRYTSASVPDGAPVSFERFTQRARDALKRASKVAESLGHGFVGTEHLLLSLFEPPEALAAQALAQLGVERAAAEALVLERIPHGSGEGIAATRPFTPRSIEALRLAVHEALQLGHNYIGTEHLLLGVSSCTDGVGSQVLTGLGATHDDLSSVISELLAGYTS